MYYALYTHKNILISENSTTGIERHLAYSGTEILGTLINTANIKEKYLRIIEYNQMTVSGILLENGYKLMIVTENNKYTDQEIQRILQLESIQLTELILSPEYDECKVHS
ncbi:hypothetical protein NEOKW01_0098 [Nematocida sp. AWRm80]|nr:hypothetical protein NEOKW01_0098 [Nematocida sp. AWRm80]